MRIICPSDSLFQVIARHYSFNTTFAFKTLTKHAGFPTSKKEELFKNNPESKIDTYLAKLWLLL